MLENGVRGGIRQTTHRYAKANNKYMKNYDKSIESSYLVFLDANNLYGLAKPQKLLVNGFKWVKNLSQFNEVDVEYPKTLFNSHKDLLFLPERKKVEKVEKLICNIDDKEKYVIHIRALKQALYHGLKLKKVHRVIQFNQEAWLKTYIDMNTKYRKEAKSDFEKDFFKLMNYSLFGKTSENVRSHRDTKLDKRRKQLASESNYHSHKTLSEHLMAIEMKKTKLKMTKSLYLGVSILDISKTLMYKFWYNNIKPKYGDRAKPCYMDTDSFVIHIKMEDFF